MDYESRIQFDGSPGMWSTFWSQIPRMVIHCIRLD